MKKLITLAAASIMTLSSAIPGFAANSVISINNGIDNTIAKGISIDNRTFAVNDNVAQSIKNVITNTVSDGDIAIDNSSVLLGENVVSITQNGVGNTVANGAVSIDTVELIMGQNVAVQTDNAVVGTAAAKDLGINTVVLNGSTAENFQGVTNNTVSGSMFTGIDINNIFN